jgi:tetratricopeptide (TPR) repeat protein
VATELNNLAELYFAMGRLCEAESLYRRSLDITERAYGPSHEKVAIALTNYAVLLRKTKRKAEARELEKRAKAIRDDSTDKYGRLTVDRHALTSLHR